MLLTCMHYPLFKTSTCQKAITTFISGNWGPLVPIPASWLKCMQMCSVRRRKALWKCICLQHVCICLTVHCVWLSLWWDDLLDISWQVLPLQSSTELEAIYHSKTGDRTGPKDTHRYCTYLLLLAHGWFFFFFTLFLFKAACLSSTLVGGFHLQGLDGCRAHLDL